MKIINKAQNKTWISFYQTNMNIMKIHFSFKDKLQGICMIYSKLKICIHIPNIKWVQNRVLHEKQMTQGYTCIFNSFGQGLHIHEAKQKIGKTCVNEGIIKTRLCMCM